MKRSRDLIPLALRDLHIPSFILAHRRLALGVVGGALTIAATLGGCNHTQSPLADQQPAPQRVVLDYRNGWYHKASGFESIEQIATHYKRESELVAELNRCGGRSAVPASGTMLYIPPVSDRTKVRELLTRLQGHPELIPKTPWDPETNSAQTTAQQSAATKPVSPAVKTRSNDVRPVATAEAVQVRVLPSNTPAVTNGKRAAELAELEPPPPGRKEIIIAEPKPAEKRGGFLSWMGIGGSKEKKPATDSAPKEPKKSRKSKPQPAAATAQAAQAPALQPGDNSFLWPVKGQVVTPYKVGWHEASHAIEIAAEEGTPVRAARAGRVLLAQAYPGYGNLILIDHGDGYATAYGYNRQILVREGQRVERGQPIASVGRPSQGSSSRLLFQVRRNALPVDPTGLLKDS